MNVGVTFEVAEARRARTQEEGITSAALLIEACDQAFTDVVTEARERHVFTSDGFVPRDHPLPIGEEMAKIDADVLVFMRLDVADRPGVAQAPNRSIVRRLGRAVEARSDRGDDWTVQLTKELLEVELGGRTDGRGFLDPHVSRLMDALRVDGFDLIDGRLVATTPGPATLGPETTILERDLRTNDFDVAAIHYRQAVESFVEGLREASNGQLRSALESTLVEVAERVVGKTAGAAEGRSGSPQECGIS